jgi:hypothetical protein
MPVDGEVVELKVNENEIDLYKYNVRLLGRVQRVQMPGRYVYLTPDGIACSSLAEAAAQMDLTDEDSSA